MPRLSMFVGCLDSVPSLLLVVGTTMTCPWPHRRFGTSFGTLESTYYRKIRLVEGVSRTPLYRRDPHSTVGLEGSRQRAGTFRLPVINICCGTSNVSFNLDLELPMDYKDDMPPAHERRDMHSAMLTIPSTVFNKILRVNWPRA